MLFSAETCTAEIIQIDKGNILVFVHWFLSRIIKDQND